MGRMKGNGKWEGERIVGGVWGCIEMVQVVFKAWDYDLLLNVCLLQWAVGTRGCTLNSDKTELFTDVSVMVLVLDVVM